MKLEILKNHLQSLGISKSLYDLTGVPKHDRICMGKTSDGVWHLFYSEKGEISTLSKFEDEDAACEEFLKLVLSAHSDLHRNPTKD